VARRGGNTSANAIWAWDAHTDTGGYGFLGLASVGLTPDDPEQQRVDLAVYWLQVKVTATDDPTRFVGELHKVLGPFPMPGTIVWTGEDGGEVADYLRTQPDVNDDDFDLIQED
jgi:hypothetical protein